MVAAPRRSFLRSLWLAVLRFDDDRGFQNAGSLAFTTLLALVPVLAIALAVASASPVFDQLIETVRRFAIAHFLPKAGGVDAVVSQLEVFRENAASLTFIGLAFLAVTAVMLLLTVDDVFNRMFRVQRQRSLARRIVLYAGLVALGPVLIGASISMTSFLVAHALGIAAEMGAPTKFVLRAVPGALTFVALALTFALVPNRPVRARHAIIGGLVGAIGFEVAKRGFGWYIAQFPTYAVIYGAFAVLPIFLLWVYVSWVVVLMGATLVAVLSESQGEA